MHYDDGRERDYKAGFVGGYNANRERSLLALADAGMLSYVVGGPWRSSQLQRLSLGANLPPEEVAELYRRTKVVVNVFREQHHFNRRRAVSESKGLRSSSLRHDRCLGGKAGSAGSVPGAADFPYGP